MSTVASTECDGISRSGVDVFALGPNQRSGAAVILSVWRDMSALRYLAFMSCSKRMCPAAQDHR